MDRPIIVITQQPGKALELAYLGTSSAEAEKVFTAKANDGDNDSVAIFYYPQARLIRYPSTESQIAADSLAAQKESQRERIRADARAAAERRLTAEAKAAIAEQAEAEANAAVQAAEQANSSDLVAGRAAVEGVANAASVKAADIAKQAVGVIVDAIKSEGAAQAAAAEPVTESDEEVSEESPEEHFASKKKKGR